MIGNIVNNASELINLTEKLKNLFGLQVVPWNERYDSHISEDVKVAMKALTSNDMVTYRYMVAKVQFLCTHLDEVRSHDEKLFKHFRNNMKKNYNNSNYYGIRFEMEIAASLIRKKIEFIKQESPDYQITHNNSLIGIECTSCHLRKDVNTKEVLYKVSSTIEKKNKKSYAQGNNILFIDATNIFYHFEKNRAPNERYPYKKYIQQSFEKSKFGALIIMTTHIAYNNEMICQSYWSFEKKDSDKIIIDFLNDHYPKESDGPAMKSVFFEG